MQVKDPVGFTTAWLNSHIKNAQTLGKPFIVEEFGKSVNARDPGTISTVRDPVFTAVYNMLSSNLKSDGIFKGEFFGELQSSERLIMHQSFLAGNTLLQSTERLTMNQFSLDDLCTVAYKLSSACSIGLHHAPDSIN